MYIYIYCITILIVGDLSLGIGKIPQFDQVFLTEGHLATHKWLVTLSESNRVLREILSTCAELKSTWYEHYLHLRWLKWAFKIHGCGFNIHSNHHLKDGENPAPHEAVVSHSVQGFFFLQGFSLRVDSHVPINLSYFDVITTGGAQADTWHLLPALRSPLCGSVPVLKALRGLGCGAP